MIVNAVGADGTVIGVPVTAVLGAPGMLVELRARTNTVSGTPLVSPKIVNGDPGIACETATHATPLSSEYSYPVIGLPPSDGGVNATSSSSDPGIKITLMGGSSCGVAVTVMLGSPPPAALTART